MMMFALPFLTSFSLRFQRKSLAMVVEGGDEVGCDAPRLHSHARSVLFTLIAAADESNLLTMMMAKVK